MIKVSDKIALMVADTSDCCSLKFAERNGVSNDNENSSWSKTARRIHKRASTSEKFINNYL